MKLYDVTAWKPSQRKVLEKNMPIWAEGATYRHHYIISFASELEMYKKMLNGIKDDYGKELNIQCKHVSNVKKASKVKKVATVKA